MDSIDLGYAQTESPLSLTVYGIVVFYSYIETYAFLLQVKNLRLLFQFPWFLWV